MKLENWSIVLHSHSIYDAPELASQCLMGNVFGDARRIDGARVNTSRIVGVDGDCIVTASGSKYELGTVEAGYGIAYPEAKFRLFNSLRKGAK